MTEHQQKLQVGGTVDPKRYLYIERPEDNQVLNLLLQGEFVNILTSRQMGKSSLMVRTARALHENGISFATIDLAGELGSQNEPDTYFLGLLNKISRDLRLEFDLKSWWQQQDAQTINQRLLEFFRNVLPEHIDSQLVIFLDEIDSTLKLSFTDDLFTVLRTIYNERSLVAEYQQVSFCLLGVATPDELVKDRRTTPYNIGKTIELRDFDLQLDDLSPLVDMFVSDTADLDQAKSIVERVLYWTGGQPYLTMMLCADVKDNRYFDSNKIDQLVQSKFASLDQVKADSHFQQVLRFVDHRFSDGLHSLELYEKVLNGEEVEDQAALPFFELRLSGLVKRDQEGKLALRNQIYQQLFDQDWINSTQPRQELEKTTIALEQSRKKEFRATTFAGVFFAGLVAVFIAYRIWYAPQQQELQVQVDAREQLAHLNVAVVADQDLGFEVLELPRGLTQAQFEQSVLLGKAIEQVSGVRFDTGQSRCPEQVSNISSVEFMREHKAWKVLDLSCTKVTDLTPLSNLGALQELNLSYTQINDISVLANLATLHRLDLSFTGITDISPLSNLNTLQRLDLSFTGVSDLSPLLNLTALQMLYLSSTGIIDISLLSNLTALQVLYLSSTGVSDLSPLSNLTALKLLDLSSTGSSDLSPLSNLTTLQRLYLSYTEVSDLSPLSNLTALQRLYLSSSGVSDLSPLSNLTILELLVLSYTQISDISSLENLTSLQWLSLSNTQISDVTMLSNLTDLQILSLSDTQVSDILPLVGLSRLDELNIENTNVTQENIDEFLNQRHQTRVNLNIISDFDKSQQFQKDGEFEQQIQQQTE